MVAGGDREPRADQAQAGGRRWSGAFGIDTKTSNLKLGAAIGYSGHQDDIGGGFNIDARGVSGSLSAAYTSSFGLYVQGAVGYAPRIKLSRIRRPGSFGPTSFELKPGQAGRRLAADPGYTAPLFAVWEGGPFVSVDYLSVEMETARVSRGGMPIGPMNLGRESPIAAARAFDHWGTAEAPSLQFAYVEVDAIGGHSLRRPGRRAAPVRDLAAADRHPLRGQCRWPAPRSTA